MIKAINLDLDGVLVDTKKIHFEALNLSLKKFKYSEISFEDHVKIFDGLPTNEKLKILNKKNNLPKKDFSKINKYKQKITSEILKKKIKKKSFKILIHCFTGSRDFAFKLLDLGAYISASGVVTFKKSQDLASTFKEIPNERILVETDSPYLAPVPLRGKPNEPSYIIHTVKYLSELKGVSFKDFSNITTKNFFNLFGQLN